MEGKELSSRYNRRLNSTISGPIRAFLTVGNLSRIRLAGIKLTRLFSADGNLKNLFSADGNLTKLFFGDRKFKWVSQQKQNRVEPVPKMES